MTPGTSADTAGPDAQIHANQRALTAEMRPSYDFIVCGSGSSGSVVARRLAESGDASGFAQSKAKRPPAPALDRQGAPRQLEHHHPDRDPVGLTSRPAEVAPVIAGSQSRRAMPSRPISTKQHNTLSSGPEPRP